MNMGVWGARTGPSFCSLQSGRGGESPWSLQILPTGGFSKGAVYRQASGQELSSPSRGSSKILCWLSYNTYKVASSLGTDRNEGQAWLIAIGPITGQGSLPCTPTPLVEKLTQELTR